MTELTPHALHKLELKRQLREQIRNTRAKADKIGPIFVGTKRAKAERGRALHILLDDQIRLLDVIDAIQEGDPLPMGWQDLRLPPRT